MNTHEMIGRTLSHYRILEKLGSGGMGDVYLAEDRALNRKVALKVLPAELAGSEDRRARFQREAQAIAALNHPHIVHVYSVEEAEGVHFITMELVRGKSLAELLPQNGFSLGKFFDVAIPLADAVAAAHAQGILHRDLKPANVMVDDDGRVKVLDFGLAKRASGLATEGSELPTETRTAEGAILGTLAYMSPEQAQGKTADHRSDVFSLGVLLYEMLTGKRPFRGDTPAATLTSVLRDLPPSVSEARRDVPRELSKLIRRMLAKEPDRRTQSALEVRNALEELRGEWSSGELGVAVKPPFSVNRWLAAAAILSLLAVAWLLTRSEGDDSAPRLVNPLQVTSAVGVENHPSWSPDGRQLAYESDRSGEWDIWVTQLGGGDVNRTTDHAGEARRPSWSPDGRQIAFFSEAADGWGLYTMPAVGGSARKVFRFFSGARRWALRSGPPTGRRSRSLICLIFGNPGTEPRPRSSRCRRGSSVWCRSAVERATSAWISAGRRTASSSHTWMPSTGAQTSPSSSSYRLRGASPSRSPRV